MIFQGRYDGSMTAHGSASSRLSPRNAAVSQQLRAAGLGTLLLDLLTERKAADHSNVSAIPLLAERLQEATRWLQRHPETADLGIGYFGASTGAAAALIAAAASPGDVAAVASRGGRPDLAGSALPSVRAATLLLVGGRDPVVLGLNQSALAWLTCFARLVMIPGASHLFEEPGTLESGTAGGCVVRAPSRCTARGRETGMTSAASRPVSRSRLVHELVEPFTGIEEAELGPPRRG